MPSTIRNELRLSIRIGLTKGLRLIHCMRRKLSETERDRIAEAIADHLALANWKIEAGEPIEPHGMRPIIRPPPDL